MYFLSYFSIVNIFNDALSTAEIIQSRMREGDNSVKWTGILREAVMVCLMVLSHHLPGQTEINLVKPREAGNQAETRNRYLPYANVTLHQEYKVHFCLT
jgi:hypothetical protein